MTKQTAKRIFFFSILLNIYFIISSVCRWSCSCADRHRETSQEPVEQAAEAFLPDAESEPAAEIEPEPEPADTCHSIIYYRRRMNYTAEFNDLNDVHLEQARRIGLSAIPADRAAVTHLGGLLVEISDNDYYVLDDLTHSMPYLTKGAASELHDIAKAFCDSLASKGFPAYRLVVSSVLRTQADVNRLRRSGNPNASENSAHCYGTTFDITYTKYDKVVPGGDYMEPFELTKVLGEVLKARRDAGKCYVKCEKKQHVFHTTTRH